MPDRFQAEPQVSWCWLGMVEIRTRWDLSGWLRPQSWIGIYECRVQIDWRFHYPLSCHRLLHSPVPSSPLDLRWLFLTPWVNRRSLGKSQPRGYCWKSKSDEDALQTSVPSEPARRSSAHLGLHSPYDTSLQHRINSFPGSGPKCLLSPGQQFVYEPV